MRIIHIVENLDKGAVENWLARIFIESRKTRPGWHWTFYCILGKPGRLDEEVRKAGGEIIYSPVTISHKFVFLQHLRKTLKTGKYDVIHSHHDFLSGFYLLASNGIKFKKRVLHIHNTDKALPVGSPWLQKILLSPFKKLAIWYSDVVVGISNDTLKEFAGNWKAGKKDFRVLYYGVDLSPFKQAADKQALLDELGWPPGSKLLLFVGRMNEFKNPVFVVDILKEILSVRNDIYGVFVGKGDLEAEVKHKAAFYGITDHIKMLGWRNDISMIMKIADVFVFPRVEYPKEGLGLVVVEAQAAGLPMALSYGIVEDAIVVSELSNFISLRNNPGEWARTILSVLDNAPLISREEAMHKVQQSVFELGIATKNLLSIYENADAA